MEFDDLPIGVIRCDATGLIEAVNARILDWLSLTDESALLGAPLHRLLHGASRIYFETHLRPLMLIEGGFSEVALKIARKPGTPMTVFVSGRARKDEAGQVEALIFTLTRSVERQNYEAELLRRTRAAKAYEALVRASPDAIVYLDTAHVITAWNHAAETLFGFTEAEAVGRSLSDTICPDGLDERRAELFETIDQRRFYRYDTRRQHKDGTIIPVELNAQPLLDDAGRRVGSVGVLRDIRERLQHEERIRVLNREVQHRAKNQLSVVMGIARQSFDPAHPEEFIFDFTNRLQALSRSLELLTDRNWTAVDLDALARGQIAPHGHLDDGRVVIEGPKVELGVQSAEALGMAFFELATNAGKYGALSGDSGRVTIRWKIGGEARDRLILDWIERGGPPVAKPSGKGFGSSVTVGLLAASTAGKVTRDFAPEGLHWRLDAPLRGLE